MQRDYLPHDRDGWTSDDWEDERPRRRGLVSRFGSLLKLTLFLAPLALFAASFLVTDCGSRSGSGLGQLLKAGACARGEILGGVLSLPADLSLLRRSID